MKVGDGLGWPGHHLAHPAHPRYAPAQGQQQQEKVKPVLRQNFPRVSFLVCLVLPAVLVGMTVWNPVWT